MQLHNQGLVEESGADGFSLRAPAETDYFIDNRTGYSRANAPCRYETVHGDFVCRVRVRPQFTGCYDAGAILVLADDRRWIKAAFEQTDLGYPVVVTVITDNASDDANGEPVPGMAVWLQVIRQGRFWAVHYSPDGTAWKMARYFEMEMPEQLRVGCSAQSPAGQGCLVRFSGFSFSREVCKDLRKGI